MFQRARRLVRELSEAIPNCTIKYRRGLDLKKIIPQCTERGYTDLLVINEDQKKPSILFWRP